MWKWNPNSMRQFKWRWTKPPKTATFRSVRKSYCFLSSTGRKWTLQSDGFETILGMENPSCTRCWQKSSFENMLPAFWRGAHFYKICKKMKKNHGKKHKKTKQNNKIKDIAKMKSQLWLQNGFKRKKCPGPKREQHFNWRMRARRRGTEGVNAPKSGPKLRFLKAFASNHFSKMCSPPRRRAHFCKSYQTFGIKGCVKH